MSIFFYVFILSLFLEKRPKTGRHQFKCCQKRKELSDTSERFHENVLNKYGNHLSGLERNPCNVVCQKNAFHSLAGRLLTLVHQRYGFVSETISSCVCGPS